MKPNVTITLTLPLSQAEKVLAFARSIDPEYNAEISQANTSSEVSVTPSAATMERETATNGQAQALRVPKPLQFFPTTKLSLRLLLDQRLQRLSRFVVERNGQFYNDELAADLGIDDPAQTFNALGHLTRKLRKVGVSAEGSRGINWYSKVRTSGRTLINVRSDVLAVLTDALKSP